jgi:hypothetical protein
MSMGHRTFTLFLRCTRIRTVYALKGNIMMSNSLIQITVNSREINSRERITEKFKANIETTISLERIPS